ncbi:MAG: hypothetical protein DRP75_00475 [Candidatus Omnitrophota bacterium]|nr:MAG: hypothetical protein DRP75_00475 [Candidatus Omnitrophota bacterium]
MCEKEKIVEVCRKYSSFLIGSHINPDGDSLGSELAFASLLKRMGKKVKVLNPTLPPSIYDFLPYREWISTKEKGEGWEVGIVLDCSEYERLREVKTFFSSLPIVINIDHHISNRRFGDINFLDTKASSVGEMVYQLFLAFAQQPTKEEALLLYVAILTDTNCFRFSTTSYTHQIISNLLATGLKPQEIQEKIYSIPFSGIKLIERVLSTLQISEDGKIVWGEINQRMIDEIREAEKIEEITHTDVLINYLCAIKDVEVVALFKELNSSEEREQEKRVKVSLRSKGKVDVNRIAKLFEGGGHFRASGCSISGELKEIESKVIEEIRKEVERSLRR